jgi:hypothetical protein
MAALPVSGKYFELSDTHLPMRRSVKSRIKASRLARLCVNMDPRSSWQRKRAGREEMPALEIRSLR